MGDWWGKEQMRQGKKNGVDGVSHPRRYEQRYRKNDS